MLNRLTHLIALSCLLLLVNGCIILPLGKRTSEGIEDEISIEVGDEGEGIAEMIEEEPDSPEAKKLHREIRGLQEDIEAQELAMEISELTNRQKLDEMRFQLQKQRRTVGKLERELKVFRKSAETRVQRSELELDSTRHFLADARAEVDQLTTLYEGSELEDGTAEYVLERSRRQLAITERRLALNERDHRMLVEETLPIEESGKVEGLEEAGRVLGTKERGLHILELEMKKGRIVEERKIRDLHEKLEEKQEALEKLTHLPEKSKELAAVDRRYF